MFVKRLSKTVAYFTLPYFDSIECLLENSEIFLLFTYFNTTRDQLLLRLDPV